MKAYTYIRQGEFGFTEKEKPVILDAHDAIVKVTLSSICTSDLHIKHGSVPRSVPGITVGHEMVGIVEKVGENVTHVKPGNSECGNLLRRTSWPCMTSLRCFLFLICMARTLPSRLAE